MDAPNCLLPKSTPHPLKTFIVKGEKGSGKSSLVNALIARNFLRGQNAQGKERTLRVNLSHEAESMIAVKEETGDIDLNIREVRNILPVVNSVQYQFLDCSDTASAEWYKIITSFCAGVILVIDKEKLDSSQSILCSTLNDIKLGRIKSQVNIPLIIVINKVDDCDDPDVAESITAFKQSVDNLVQAQSGDNPLVVGFVAMSALDAFLYRAFSVAGSFDRLATKDIIRLCGLELGAQAKSSAREIDNHSNLETELSRRVQTADGERRWMHHTGLGELCRVLSQLVFHEDVFFPALSAQLRQQLKMLTSPIAPPSVASVTSTRRSQPYAYSNVVSQQQHQESTASPYARYPPPKQAPPPPPRPTSFLGNMFGSSPSASYPPSTSNLGNTLVKKDSFTVRSPGGSQPAPSPNTPAETESSTREHASSDELLGRLSFCLAAHNEYASVQNISPEKPVDKSYLREIKLACRNKYRECLDAYIESTFLHSQQARRTPQSHFIGGINTAATQDFLSVLNTHQAEDLKEMCKEEEWSKLRVDALAVVVELVWCGRKEAGLFSTTQTAPAYIQADQAKIQGAASTTLRLIRSILLDDSPSSSPSLLADKLVQHMIIPLIRNLPTAVAMIPVPEEEQAGRERTGRVRREDIHDERKSSDAQSSVGSNAMEEEAIPSALGYNVTKVIEIEDSDDEVSNDKGFSLVTTESKVSMVCAVVYLEKGIIPIVQAQTSETVQKEFYQCIVSKKVDIRHKLPGYTTCCRELLTKHPSLKETNFALFFPVIHNILPECDVIWGRTLPKSTNYFTAILGSGLLDSERQLQLLLSPAAAFPPPIPPGPRGEGASSASLDTTSVDARGVDGSGDDVSNGSAPKRKRGSTKEASPSRPPPVDRVEEEEEAAAASSNSTSSRPATRRSRNGTPNRMRLMRSTGEC